MPIEVSFDPEINMHDFKGWFRVMARGINGSSECLYNGYRNFPYRLVARIIDLRDEFGKANAAGANSQLHVSCHRGQAFSFIQLNETPEEIIAQFQEHGLRLPNVEKDQGIKADIVGPALQIA